VAANVVALGSGCEVVGGIGTDFEGKLLRDHLDSLGVGTTGLLELEDRPTTVKTRIMARHQHVTRIDREIATDISADQGEALAASVRNQIGACDAVALEDYNKGVMVPSLIRATLSSSQEKSLPSVVDPKRLRFFEFHGASVFKPNSRELEDAVGERLQPEDPAWMEGVRARLGCETLLLTLGEEGMAIQGADGSFLRVPTAAREVYDVSGAGDTVTAVMSVALGAGASPFEAAVLANHAAAVEVGKAGVATVTPDEILKQQEAFTQEEET
jgi:D-beta-D-heptose 7-phosphate kinase/D-beta-D-heptose 1-phosphate adenosyltransferase